MENNKENMVEQPKAETTTKNRVKSVVKTAVILAAACGLGFWFGKRGFKGMGDDVKAGLNTLKNAMPKKQANVEVEVREPRNEYRGHNNNHGNNNKNYNN
jgi:hypothetical protein